MNDNKCTIEEAMNLPIDADMVWSIAIYANGHIYAGLIRQGQGEYYSETDIASAEEDTIANSMLIAWLDWQGVNITSNYRTLEMIEKATKRSNRRSNERNR